MEKGVSKYMYNDYQYDVDRDFNEDPSPIQYYLYVNCKTLPLVTTFYMNWKYEPTYGFHSTPLSPSEINFQIHRRLITDPHNLGDWYLCRETSEYATSDLVHITSVDFVDEGITPELVLDDVVEYRITITSNNKGHLTSVSPMFFYTRIYDKNEPSPPVSPFICAYDSGDILMDTLNMMPISTLLFDSRNGPIVLNLHVPWFYNYAMSHYVDTLFVDFSIQKIILTEGMPVPPVTLPKPEEIIHKVSVKALPDSKELTQLNYVDTDSDFPPNTRLLYRAWVTITNSKSGLKTYEPFTFQAFQYPLQIVGDIPLLNFDFTQQTFEPIDSVYSKEIGHLYFTYPTEQIDAHPVYLTAIANVVYSPYAQYPSSDLSNETKVHFIITRKLSSDPTERTVVAFTFDLTKDLPKTLPLQFYEQDIPRHLGEDAEYILYCSCRDSYVNCVTSVPFIGRQYLHFNEEDAR